MVVLLVLLVLLLLVVLLVVLVVVLVVLLVVLLVLDQLTPAQDGRAPALRALPLPRRPRLPPALPLG